MKKKKTLKDTLLKPFLKLEYGFCIRSYQGIIVNFVRCKNSIMFMLNSLLFKRCVLKCVGIKWGCLWFALKCIKKERKGKKWGRLNKYGHIWGSDEFGK